MNKNIKRIKYQLIWIPIVIYFFGIIFSYISINSKTIDIIMNNEANISVGELRKDIVIEQSFISPSDNIDSIDIQFATYGRKNINSTLYVKLYDSTNEYLLNTWNFNANNIEDNSYLQLKIPNNILLNKNNEYILILGSEDGIIGNSVTMWASNTDRYKSGQLTINGYPFIGDLVITFHILKKYNNLLFVLYNIFNFLVILFFVRFTIYYMYKRVDRKKVSKDAC